MRKYWTIRRGIQYPTTITIPIPTEPEIYMTAAVTIMFCMWWVVVHG